MDDEFMVFALPCLVFHGAISPLFSSTRLQNLYISFSIPARDGVYTTRRISCTIKQSINNRM